MSEPKQSAGGAKPGRGPKGPRSEARGLQNSVSTGRRGSWSSKARSGAAKTEKQKAH